MKKVKLLVLFIFLLDISCPGQKLNVLKLDSLFTALDTRNLAMGSVAISKNGIMVYQRAIGYAYINGGEKIPADIHTKYRFGSVSKMFTAVMIFQLIEEGKIGIDQKLNFYFPDIPNAGKITISNLLNHRSGLHNYSAETNFPDWMDQPRTHDEILKIIKEKGSDFEAGTKAEYSNTNYLLLGYIIEKVCKMSYKQALGKRILSKIGLRETTYMGPIDIKKNESTSYKYSAAGWKKEKETNASIHNGAGSIVSTPAGMVKFIDALFTYRLIKKSSLDTMKTMTDGYGRGIFPFMHGLKSGYGHGGRIEEFYSALQYYPADKLAFAYTTNGVVYPMADIIDDILKICFNEVSEVPFSNTALLKRSDFDKYLGEYASSQLPIAVTCTKVDSKLLMVSKGKSFEIEPVSDDYFMNAQAGLFFKFLPEKGELIIKEADGAYHLSRQK